MDIYYRNTDLVIESSNDLTPIVEAFGEDVFNLYNGQAHGHYMASFEMAGLVDSPDAIIQHFCMFAEALTGDEKVLWDNCFSRVFDIGYEGGTGHKSYTDEIRANTLDRVAALGASIRITVYPMELGQNDENQP